MFDQERNNLIVLQPAHSLTAHGLLNLDSGQKGWF